MPKRSPRGRAARQLQPVRSTDAEIKWVHDQAALLGVSVVQFQRDRIFEHMPGYRRIVGSQPADGRKHAVDCPAYDGGDCDCPARLPPFVPYDPTVRKGG